jgi:hypothetical protein
MFAERTTVSPEMSGVYPAVFEFQADFHGIATIADYLGDAVGIFKNRVIEIIDKKPGETNDEQNQKSHK